MRVKALSKWLSITCVLSLAGPASAADPPSVKLVLTFRPIQQDVEYDKPTADMYDQCTVKVERMGKSSGWIVLGPQGETLRRFVDTNGDNVVDQWRYFNQGIEVYRDIDSNLNNKVDQSRWLNTAGARWGIDSNEDGRIDQWKVLSAEEATREAIQALVARDEKAMESLMINREDLRALGISDAFSQKLLDNVGSLPSKIRDAYANGVNDNTKWMRFDGAMPSAIPADNDKTKSDLNVYENAMAIIETKGEPSLVQIGEMVRVGDVWKLTQVPLPLKGNTVQVTQGGILMQPSLTGEMPDTPVPSIDPEMQKLITELQELDSKSPPPTATRSAVALFHDSRAELVAKLIVASKSETEREQWTKQMADSIAAAVQSGTYPKGVARLTALEKEVVKSSPGTSLAAYIAYRRLLAEYSQKLQAADPEKGGAEQEWWMKQLETFVEEFPDSDDAAEAMVQLANTSEFLGKLDDAKKWYTQATQAAPESGAATRAAGALRRLDLNGKTLSLSGPALNGGTIDIADYRGKVVLVSFWATWCGPCTEELPELRALYDEYHKKGFEIVGVNIDMTAEPVVAFLKQNKVTWPQMHDDGGFDSEPAKAFGIILPPTQFLVDRKGVVVAVNPMLADLKTEIPKLLDPTE